MSGSNHMWDTSPRRKYISEDTYDFAVVLSNIPPPPYPSAFRGRLCTHSEKSLGGNKGKKGCEVGEGLEPN